MSVEAIGTTEELLNLPLEVFVENADSVTAFAHNVLDIDLHGYQEEVAEYDGKRMIIAWGRQLGKSVTVAIKALHYALHHPWSKILILAPFKMQSMIIYDTIRQLVVDNPYLKNSIRITERKMKVTNGAVIENISTSDKKGANFRGKTAHLLIYDEFSYCMYEDDVYTSMQPVVSAAHGAVILIGTPNGKLNLFYDVYEDARAGTGDYILACKDIIEERGFEGGIPSRMGLEYTRFDKVLGKRVSQIDVLALNEAKRLAEKRGNINGYLAEYECLFLEAMSSYYPSSLVEKSAKSWAPYDFYHEGECYLGYDIGGSKDSSAFAVGTITENKDGDRGLRVLKTWEKKPDDLTYGGLGECDVAKDLEFIENEIMPFYRISTIYLDKTGAGKTAGQMLTKWGKMYNIVVVEITFTRMNKVPMHARIKTLMGAGLFEFSASEKTLYGQFLIMEAQQSKVTKTLTIDHPPRGHDDVLAAVIIMGNCMEFSLSYKPTLATATKSFKDTEKTSKGTFKQAVESGGYAPVMGGGRTRRKRRKSRSWLG